LHFEREHSWLPIADWMLVFATTAALVLVIIPLLVFDLGSNLRLPRAACAASSVLLTGYLFGIMAHYRLIFGGGTKYEPHPTRRITAGAEAIITGVAAVGAVVAFLIAY
jgi:heptaprenylglyceryl phosphate synthase